LEHRCRMRAFCMNSTLIRIAMVASAPMMKPTASRELHPSAWNSPRRASTSSSTAVPFARPARAVALRTFLCPHGCRMFEAAGDRPLDRRRFAATSAVAIYRQVKGDPRALAQPACDLDLPAMQRQQPLDDRQAEAGAGVAAIVARARLEKRV